MPELNDKQVGVASDLAGYFSMRLAEVLAKNLSRSVADRLQQELNVLIRRGAESFARELLKMKGTERAAYIERIASQNS